MPPSTLPKQKNRFSVAARDATEQGPPVGFHRIRPRFQLEIKISLVRQISSFDIVHDDCRTESQWRAIRAKHG